MEIQKWDHTYDVVVVGSGASGLTAAITAENNGMKTLVIEKLDKWGGTSALSGGGLWAPNHFMMKENGYLDSEEEALTYLESIIEDVGEASSRERKIAYVKNCSEMVLFLKNMGFKWIMGYKYPDYHPTHPGAKTGRVIEPDVFDGKKLGASRKTQLEVTYLPPIVMGANDVVSMPLALNSWGAFKRLLSVLRKTAWIKITGKKALTLGSSLTGQMRYILQSKYKTPIWLSTSLKDLIIENGRVVGVQVEKEGKTVYIKAEKGVLLGAGGFEKNDEYRKKYQPVGAAYTAGSLGSTGDVHQLAEKKGLALSLMEEAWWAPGFILDGYMNVSLYERSLPGAIMIDQSGQRYLNESASYVVVGRKMLDRHAEMGGAIPSWLILDGENRKKYFFNTIPPRITPQKYIRDNTIIKANSLDDLARQCGIDADKLKQTVKRFNSFARQGLDEDFHRGDDIYDRYYSDHAHRPNSNLGAIQNPPFYAIKMYPTDLGTKGGLLTDEHGRVLKKDLSPIEGLYASGNNTASVMGRMYPGPGSTIGAACTFSYIAMKHLAKA